MHRKHHKLFCNFNTVNQYYNSLGGFWNQRCFTLFQNHNGQREAVDAVKTVEEFASVVVTMTEKEDDNPTKQDNHPTIYSYMYL